MTQIVSSDVTILDLLRRSESLTITELSDAMGVTATAVRQRLNRLMAQGFVDRVAQRVGRGRPNHRYALTADGRRQTGANFADLAVALWEEIRAISDPEVRRGLLRRIADRLVQRYSGQVRGTTVEERMRAVADLFSHREMPFDVTLNGSLPVLHALGCPYPDLAERDRSVCAMERGLLSELIGSPLRLSGCRLDGQRCCSFEFSEASN